MAHEEVIFSARRVLLNRGEVAKMLGVAERTLHDWREAGEMPSGITINGRMYWPVGLIERWIESGCPRFAKSECIGEELTPAEEIQVKETNE